MEIHLSRYPAKQKETGNRSACSHLRKLSMRVHLLKGKLHRATVTGASLDYEGSLTIAEDLIERAGFLPFERILCSNLTTGARWETYVIPGPRQSGVIELNGAVARLGQIGDRLTIMAFAEV